MSREEFTQAIAAFMEELSAICAAQTSEGLRVLKEFTKEALETRSLLSDPKVTDERLLSLSFGLVDEYFGARREAILNEAYEYYLNKPGGRT
jgi:hypothetical protein